MSFSIHVAFFCESIRLDPPHILTRTTPLKWSIATCDSIRSVFELYRSAGVVLQVRMHMRRPPMDHTPSTFGLDKRELAYQHESKCKNSTFNRKTIHPQSSVCFPYARKTSLEDLFYTIVLPLSSPCSSGFMLIYNTYVNGPRIVCPHAECFWTKTPSWSLCWSIAGKRPSLTCVVNDSMMRLSYVSCSKFMSTIHGQPFHSCCTWATICLICIVTRKVRSTS